jgi:uncharacterized membrane protein
MFGLTFLGIVHTAISLVALATGVTALVRYRRIAWAQTVGRVYIVATALTCLTGFGIFQHGGFGKPHALGIITLVVLALALGSELRGWFGKRARYVAPVAYSATVLFHLIPGITETTTRLPLGAPLLASPEAPELQIAAAVLFVVWLMLATLQVLQMRSHPLLDSLDEELPLKHP